MQVQEERVVRSISPGQMVFRRFIRNRLAISGAVLLIIMFLFSFLGPFFVSYGEAQVFYRTEYMMKDYAGAVENTELNYLTGEQDLGAMLKRAIANEENGFVSDGHYYSFRKLDDRSYEIARVETIAAALKKWNQFFYRMPGGRMPDAAFRSAFEEAYLAGASSFSYEGQMHLIGKYGRDIVIGPAQTAAYATTWTFYPWDTRDLTAEDFRFQGACIRAIAAGSTLVEVDGVRYRLETIENGYMASDENGDKRALISDMRVNAAASDVRLSGEFRQAFCEAVRGKSRNFTILEDGEQKIYQIEAANGIYLARKEMPAQIRCSYESPSAAHLLGLDGNGMDVLTRLMYGGRISLLVGFAVVAIELAIGVAVGGIAGYFGGAADTVLMRVVDLFNSIPFWPMVLIFGSVMDSMEISPYARLFVLMMILGLLGWTGIARVVRGQILSLREQDFIVATEATGIRVARRIFRHLIPNVMPLLIVQTTMALGGIILTEATMSFLGLGVKYPMASWGSIINAANDIRVMTNYWFIWLPAGALIMLTVLGFNFVGDGLRDAFDPRMKR